MQKNGIIIQTISDLLFEKTGQHLSSIQKLFLQELLDNPKTTYEEIAKVNSYSVNYIKNRIAPETWQALSSIFGKPFNKNNFASLIQQYSQNNPTFSKMVFMERMESKVNCSLENPEGLVPLTSPFYIERPPLEKLCYQEILKPRALLRIKAPRKMGKTSLMTRVLFAAAQKSYAIVSISLNTANQGLFESSDKFLRWVCANTAHQLGLTPDLDQYWDEDLGGIVSASLYLQGYILKKVDSPLILAFDEINQLFDYPELARDFLVLLRSWHEETRNVNVWSKLRLLIVHSTDVYLPIDINRSPFNVGISVDLLPFNAAQIRDLAQKHHLKLSDFVLNKIIHKTGGIPYLVRVLFHYSICSNLPLDFLPEHESCCLEIYEHHLQELLWNLLQKPQLAETYRLIVNTDEPVKVKQEEGFKLKSLGLIELESDRATPSCDLYRQYFREHF